MAGMMTQAVSLITAGAKERMRVDQKTEEMQMIRKALEELVEEIRWLPVRLAQEIAELDTEDDTENEDDESE